MEAAVSRNEEFMNAHWDSELFDEVNERDWYHGTSGFHDENIRRKGARVGFTDSPQTQGPGFYVFGSEEKARAHALDVADSSYETPVVQTGHAGPVFPMRVAHSDLERIGRQFRRDNPRVHPLIHDAALGNISLRQRGVDFLHVTENHNYAPVDYGVVLRPGVWSPKGRSTEVPKPQEDWR